MRDHAHVHLDCGRRQFLHNVLAGAVVGIAAQAGSGLAFPPTPPPPTPPTPPAPLPQFIPLNQPFVAQPLPSIAHDLTILREHTVEKQEPFAAVLACADSRVPVELVFDQTIGHIFVTRIAGNIATPEIIASLEYGVAVLKISALLV